MPSCDGSSTNCSAECRVTECRLTECRVKVEYANIHLEELERKELENKIKELEKELASTHKLNTKLMNRLLDEGKV